MSAQTIFDITDASIGHSDGDAWSFGVGNVFERSPDATDKAANGNANAEPEGDERKTAGGHDRTKAWEPDHVQGHRKQDSCANDAADETTPQ